MVGVILHYITSEVMHKNCKNLGNTMIRLTPQSRFHVSNRAAVLTALLLIFSSFTGLSNNQDYDQKYMDNPESSVAQSEENADNSTANDRKVNLSLLLFGRG